MNDETKTLPEQVKEVFGPEGVLEENLSHFRPRREQGMLALAVTKALHNQQSAVLEAGTGTGKTYAYLAPILLSDKKAVISTSTKGLQEQLIENDLPEMMKALGKVVDTCVLKGRANYICKHRLQLARSGGLDLEIASGKDKPGMDELSKIEEYMNVTTDGDRAGVHGVSDRSRIWPLVTSTSTNCARRSCDHYSDCFVYQARDRARKCHLVVANHALMFADAAHRLETGEPGIILPGREVVVFDEAHSLPDDLPNHFGQLLAVREVGLMAEEGFSQCQAIFPHRQDASKAFNSIKDICGRMLALSNDQLMGGSLPVNKVMDVDGMQGLVDNLGDSLTVLNDLDLAQEVGEEDEGGNDFKRLVGAMEKASGFLEEWPASEGKVNWVNAGKNSLQLWSAPLDSARLFHENFIAKVPCLMLSATMSFDDSLVNYKRRVGADAASEFIVGSPFDYVNNSMLLLPPDMPDPNDYEAFCAAYAKVAVPLVRSNKGRALLLFSSWKVLHRVHHIIERQFQDSCKLLVHGKGSPPHVLLEEFRKGNSVLLGTRTFWQGIDVRGDALSLVIVDKIPFASHDDPIIEAEIASYEDRGWWQVQLPRATQILKQGAGRLIRGEDDHGVLVICDRRMTLKSYGKTILNNLPPMKLTYDPKAAAAFLKSYQ